MGGVRKATLTIGGTSIIERQLAVLHQVAAPVFLVTSAHAPGDAEPHGRARRVSRITARSVASTRRLSTSPHERTLVVACDMPFLNAALLGYMAGIDADLVIPRTTRGYEPLCAIYGRACAASIRERLTRGELEASRLPEGVRVAEVGPETLAAYDPDGLLFVNVNTPHDYERAKEVLERRSKTSRDRIMDELGP